MPTWKKLKQVEVTVTHSLILDARPDSPYRVFTVGDKDFVLTFVHPEYVEPGTILRVAISKQVNPNRRQQE